MPFLDRLSQARSASGPLAARAAQALAARDAATVGTDVYRPSTAARTPHKPDRTCGAAGCTSSWVRPWKNRRRPIFEEEWGCSGRCLHTLVQAAVRREVGEGSGMSTDRPHQHRVPLGLVLLAQGWITHPQLLAALESQKSSGQGRIGDWLMQSGLAEERITRGLGVQWNCPVLALEGFSPSAMALAMPKRFLAEFGLLPLRVAASSILYVAFDHQLNAAAALGVEQMSSLRVESGLLSVAQFETARERLLQAEAVPATTTQVPDADALTAGIAKVLETRQPVASRLVRVHQYYWLRTWLENGAIGGAGQLPRSAEDVHDDLFHIGPAGKQN